jgi:uncharacterized protein (DUF849 family)
MAEFEVVLRLRVDGTKKQATDSIVALIEAIRQRPDDRVIFVDAAFEEPIQFERKRR